jgi:copper resistance protein B
MMKNTQWKRMNINLKHLMTALCISPLSFQVAAEKSHAHGSEIYRAGEFQAAYSHANEESSMVLSLDSWIGTDEQKLIIRSEVEYTDDSETNEADLQLLYSRLQSDFWDAHIGLKQRLKPESRTWLVAGVAGLARYFLETEAYLFLSDDGHIKGSIAQESELLITQKWALHTGYELDAYLQDDEEEGVASGPSSLTLSLTSIYEFNRAVAPYLSFEYGAALFDTRAMLNDQGEDVSGWTVQAGIQLMF